MSSRTEESVHLFLQGTPVNFTQRNHSKILRNSSNSVMTIRPFSANSYKEDKTVFIDLKRPLSADAIFCNDKIFANMNSNEYENSIATKEISTEIPELPSSQILKSLLSEPLNNWNFPNKHLNPSSESNKSRNSDNILEDNIIKIRNKSISDLGILVPGIKTKPPLPDKPKKKDTILNVNIFPKRDNIATENLETREKYFDEEIDNICLVDLEDIDKLENFYNDIQDTETAENENISNTSFRNWLQESKNLTLETKLLETQTDIELQKVHKHQDDLKENMINLETFMDENEIFKEKTKRIETKSSFKNSVTLPKQKEIVKKPPKLPTKNKPILYRTEFQPNKTKQSKKEPIKKPKSILKTVSISKKPSDNVKNKENSKLSEKELKEEQVNDNEINSWMSSTPKHENFLEFLNSLDDLNDSVEETPQLVSPRSFMEDIPEHDQEENDFEANDEIESILEVLEKEDLKSQKTIESYKEILNNELSDANNLKQSNTRNNDSRNSDSISCTSLDPPNYNDFITYLEEVDKNCFKTLQTAKDRVKTANKVTNTVLTTNEIPKIEDLLNYTTVDLAHNVISLIINLKEKSNGILTLQSEINKLRTLISAKAEEHEKILKQKLKIMKDEYEPVIKRHQKFIDQLIADKKGLNQQCENLIGEIKVLEDRYCSNMKAIEQRHKIDLQKAKDMHMAAEKLRREKWIEGKTQKIKEMTAKGLEPELQNLTTRHQQEIADLRSLHKRELEDLELKAARTTQQQCEALRQQLTMERENAITHEREILRQRLEKLVESEEKSYQELRRRLNAEHADRLSECEERIANLTNEKDRTIEAARIEFEDRLQIAQRRQNTELKSFKDNLDLEFDIWKNNFRKQMNIKMTETEAQLRDMCKKERDKEIELVIERLEQETSEMKAQIEQVADNRLRRLKEKYEEEIKELETTTTDYKTKYSEAKEKLLSAEDNIINLKTCMKQLQSQYQQIKEVNDELSLDKNKVREQLKEEFIAEIKNLEEEVKALKNNKEAELHKIFARVKVTVDHKDELLAQLSQNNKNLQEKCTLLENLLEQQRKDFFLK